MRLSSQWERAVKEMQLKSIRKEIFGLFVFLSIYVFVFLSVCQAACLSVYLSVYSARLQFA